VELHVGLDASVATTSLCTVDEKGAKLLEKSVLSEPEALNVAVEGKSAMPTHGRNFVCCSIDKSDA